jgi:transmembrane sensor
MENNSAYYIELITRYLSNETTVDEAEILAEWLTRDPENLKQFNEFQKSWEIIEKARMEQLDVDAAWAKLERKIRGLQGSPAEIQRPAHVMNERGRVFRNRFVNRMRPVHYQRVLKMAAVIILLAIPAFLLFRYFIPAESKTLNAASGIIESQLPDGTSVTLNTGSLLEYPARFGASKRDVMLAGEAWFEVAHDKSKPFIISNGKVRIEVLGTSFYVNTKTAGGNTEVILSSGRVAIYYKDRPSVQVMLTPGEKAEILTGEEKISKSSNDDENFLSWKTKRFVFTDDPMSEIVQTLNKVYHIKITLANATISGCRVTATFDNQSLGSILNVLKSTLNLTIQNNGSEIEISGDGCR